MCQLLILRSKNSNLLGNLNFYVPKYFLKMQFRVNIVQFKNFEMLTFGVYISNIFMYFYAHCNRFIRVSNIASISHCSIQNLVKTSSNKF